MGCYPLGWVGGKGWACPTHPLPGRGRVGRVGEGWGPTLLERWSTLPNCGLHDRRFTRICADMATVKPLGVAYTPHLHSESVPGMHSMATREPTRSA